MKKYVAILAVVVFLSSCYYDKEELLYGVSSCDTLNVKYNVQVVNILSANCLRCHGGDASDGRGVQLGSYNAVRTQAFNGKLLGVISHTPGFLQMPKDGGKLTNCQIATIEAWIRKGAPNN
jgi:hypothetical protein